MNCDDAISIHLAAFEADYERDVIEHPWRYTDEEIAEVRWRHIENDDARELVKALHQPCAGRDGLRVTRLVEMLEDAPTDLFWTVFLNTWPNCGRTWPFQQRLLQMLRDHTEHSTAVNYMHSAAVAFFDRLPPVVTVFRGCTRDRIPALSWTTDKSTAMEFSRGDVDGAVLAMATISKTEIFAVCIDRQESEIIVDPDHLRELQLLSTPALATSAGKSN